MARFDVCRHPDAALRKNTPFLIDLQNNYINGSETRVVVPLRPAKLFEPPMRDLNPLFELDGVQFVLDTAALAAFPVTELRTPATNLQSHSDTIVDALDTLFGS
jgi:toxin CcdB